MTKQPLRFIVGAVQILVGLALGWLAISSTIAFFRADDEPASTGGMLTIAGLLLLTAATAAACIANGWRLVNRPKFAPAYWKRLPTLTAVLLGLTLLLWFTGVPS